MAGQRRALGQLGRYPRRPARGPAHAGERGTSASQGRCGTRSHHRGAGVPARWSGVPAAGGRLLTVSLQDEGIMATV